jgi:hypothetical protein
MYILVEKQRDFQYEMSLVDCYQLKQQDEYVVESIKIIEECRKNDKAVEPWRLMRIFEGKMPMQWRHGVSSALLKDSGVFVVAMQTERMRKLGATRSMEETVDLEMSEEIGKVSVV